MKMFKEFDSLNVQRLIIDIRNNVGGTNFFETPLMNGICQRPEINNPEKLFLIIGRITFSAGQHLATQVTKYTKATLLGEATSGKPNHFGSSRRFQLPNSKLVIKCSIDDIQDSEPFDWSMATWPDIFVPITSTDYERNFDPIIESIYNYNNLLTSFQNFEQILHQAYFAESVEGLIKKNFLLSDSIKKIGMKRKLLQIDLQNWLWENKKNMEDYTQYLFFLEKEFPDSFEVYYSLGIRMMNSDRLEEASDYFNKCLKLQPAHRYAKMNLKTIELNPDNENVKRVVKNLSK